jgi:DNA-binding NtrC family response regulator
LNKNGGVHKVKFLLIDDVAETERIRQMILDFDPKHEVDMSHSSLDALKQFRKRGYDVVITEIYLKGGIQGNEIIESSARSQPYPCFKVGVAEYLDNPMIRQPFNHFIIKPITKDHIQQLIVMAEYNIQYHLI